MEILVRDKTDVEGFVTLGAFELLRPISAPIFPRWFTRGVRRVAPDETAGLMDRLLERSSCVRPIYSERRRNLVTDVGRDNLAALMLGTGFEASAISLGTGSTAPAESDTALDSEQFRGEITARVSASKKSTWYMFVDDGEANGFTYLEAGLNNNTVPNAAGMLARGLVPSTLKEPGVVLTIEWEWNYP